MQRRLSGYPNILPPQQEWARLRWNQGVSRPCTYPWQCLRRRQRARAASERGARAFARGSVSVSGGGGECNRRFAALPKAMTTTAHCAIAPPVATLSACVVYAKASRRPREGGNRASLSHPQPPHAPGRSVRQKTSTRQLTVVDMPKSEYDDSNAAAKDPVPSPRRV